MSASARPGQLGSSPPDLVERLDGVGLRCFEPGGEIGERQFEADDGARLHRLGRPDRQIAGEGGRLGGPDRRSPPVRAAASADTSAATAVYRSAAIFQAS